MYSGFLTYGSEGSMCSTDLTCHVLLLPDTLFSGIDISVEPHSFGRLSLSVIYTCLPLDERGDGKVIFFANLPFLKVERTSVLSSFREYWTMWHGIACPSLYLSHQVLLAVVLPTGRNVENCSLTSALFIAPSSDFPGSWILTLLVKEGTHWLQTCTSIYKFWFITLVHSQSRSKRDGIAALPQVKQRWWVGEQRRDSCILLLLYLLF